jgi:hypothetical protein
LSSAAAPALGRDGSPLRGGYADAKATQRFISRYAREEAMLAALDVTFSTVLPPFAPSTDVSRLAFARASPTLRPRERRTRARYCRS